MKQSKAFNLRILLVAALAILLAAVFFARNPGILSCGGPAAAPAASGLPEMAEKPSPKLEAFRGCPPEGDGGDPELNRLKNRVDEGSYLPVQFDPLLHAGWPEAIERRDRARWSDADRRAVGRYEGLPLSVEGYLANVRLEGPESPNCHGADSDFRDYHMWLVRSPGGERESSVVVEVTPAVRARHTAWDLPSIRALVRENRRVRISGWLLLDPEHPDQVGKTRGTIWEIHPVMKIEIARGGSWVALDGHPL